MLRVAEQYAGTDTGRQRRANEDSLLARAPLFVVADGMGGAQAGEVASRIAVETFQPGLADASHPELALAALARAANARIHELSHANAEQAGMGTTLTAAYVGEQEVAIAHVGDSRAYCLRDGQLLRLTDDHSLVDELMRQGRLTPEEAVEHPQRSVITRALGPEGTVEVDTRSFRARAGDVYLLCSDGLTTMISEELIAATLIAHPPPARRRRGADRRRQRGRRTRQHHGRADPPGGGRSSPAGAAVAGAVATMVGRPAPCPRSPVEPRRAPAAPAHAARRRAPTPRGTAPAADTPRGRARVRAGGAGPARIRPPTWRCSRCTSSAPTAAAWSRSSRACPYQLPGNLTLYSSQYVSGVSASTLSPEQRHKLLDHSLRSEGDAGSLIHSLELEQLE